MLSKKYILSNINVIKEELESLYRLTLNEYKEKSEDMFVNKILFGLKMLLERTE